MYIVRGIMGIMREHLTQCQCGNRRQEERRIFEIPRQIPLEQI